MQTELTLHTLEDPLRRRIRIHAARVNLSAPETTTEALKSFMAQENEILSRLHRQGQSGLRVAMLRSMVMDVLIESLVERTLSANKVTEGKGKFAILALGGYGREELCPFSDIDLMFFLPSGDKKNNDAELQKALTDGVLYPLWDLGFKVGHSTRNLEQVLEEAGRSVESKNALLESRLITGSKPLWKTFQREYRAYIRKGKIGPYIEERQEAEDKRHQKFGYTIFLQEPDIKNGVGGLRDYQNAMWMARLKLGITTVSDLADSGYLNKTEQQEFADAYDFLLRVRTELHMQVTRPTDLLDLEKQTQVAWYLGYRYRDITRRVEYFMRDYYSNCDVIHRISGYLQFKMAKDSRRKKLRLGNIVPLRRNVTPNDGFIIKEGTIQPVHENVFAEDPERLIRVFRHAQQSRVAIDRELQRMIRNNAHLVDKRIVNSPNAAKAFLTIMQQPGEVFPTLNLMNECGVLAMFIPEWKNMYCLVQHEFYHRFTADYHTLNTIRELDRIFTNTDSRVGAPYLRELRDTQSPTLPYLALFLHDIGKGLGISGHAHRGAEIAKTVLVRLGYNPDLGTKIIDIIEHHLDMARFWQRFDVEDPQTAESFAKVITDEDTLRYLYVLTYCDAKGTSGDLWNSYKNSLHRQLFKSTLAMLAGQHITHTPEAMIPKELIKEKLPEISEDEIEAHYNLLPERYFIYNNADEIVLHIRMVNELLRRISEADSLETLVPVVHWQDDLSLSMTVVNIVTWDRSGLFYKLSGAFSVAGLSIVSSKAITRADHITVDTFYVCDASGGIVQNKSAHAIVEKYLKKALVGNEDLMPAIEEQERKVREASWTRTTLPIMRSPIAPSVGVYHELSLKHTIVEIQCEDRIGLLYNIAKAIFEHGFDITFARIATERGVAMDTFYIEPIDKETIDSGNLLPLREKLNTIISKKPRESGITPDRRKIAQ